MRKGFHGMIALLGIGYMLLSSHVAHAVRAAEQYPNPEARQYYALLSKTIRQQYWRAQDACPAWASATFRIVLDTSGTIRSVETYRASGFPSCDRAVHAVIEHASSLPPPPEALREKATRNGLVFHYVNNVAE